MASNTTPVLKDIGAQGSPKGIVLCAKATVTIPATGGPGIGELAALMTIPKGAEVLDVVAGGVLGVATMTLSVGDAGAAGRFIAAGAAGAAPFLLRNTLGAGYKYAADTVLNLTFNTAAPTAAQVYDVLVYYKMS